MTKNTHLPATTGLGSLGFQEAQILGLRIACNVIMPNFTPLQYRENYKIYDNKIRGGEILGDGKKVVEKILKEIKRFDEFDNVLHNLINIFSDLDERGDILYVVANFDLDELQDRVTHYIYLLEQIRDEIDEILREAEELEEDIEVWTGGE